MTTDLWQRIDLDETTPRYRFGTQRAVPPAVTLLRVRPLLRSAGITRLADITGLDWIGIPVYQAIRPNSRTLAASQGKGLTRVQAKVSALMEALEVFHAEEITQTGVRETVGRMRRQLPYDPGMLALRHPTLLTDALVLDWIPATDLWSGAPTWVPRDVFDLNLCVAPRVHLPVYRTSSNGLCSGNTVTEALIHGICEVVERDSCLRHDRARFEPERSIILESVCSTPAKQLVDRFLRAGMRLQLVEMTGPTGLPCFEVWIDHPDGPFVTEGSGCHPRRTVALVRALTEAAQSRLTYIAGTRDDIERRLYRASTGPGGRHGFRPATTVARRSFRAGAMAPPERFRDQLRAIVGRVRDVTGMSPVAVELTRPEFGIPVMVVVAPGLQTRPTI